MWKARGRGGSERVGTNGFARRYNISSYSWMETGCRGGREDRERNAGVARLAAGDGGEGRGNEEETGREGDGGGGGRNVRAGRQAEVKPLAV